MNSHRTREGQKRKTKAQQQWQKSSKQRKKQREEKYWRELIEKNNEPFPMFNSDTDTLFWLRREITLCSRSWFLCCAPSIEHWDSVFVCSSLFQFASSRRVHFSSLGRFRLRFENDGPRLGSENGNLCLPSLFFVLSFLCFGSCFREVEVCLTLSLLRIQSRFFSFFAAPMSASFLNVERKEKLRQLALETTDISNVMKSYYFLPCFMNFMLLMLLLWKGSICGTQ